MNMRDTKSGLNPILSKRAPHPNLDKQFMIAPELAAQVNKLSEILFASPKVLYV